MKTPITIELDPAVHRVYQERALRRGTSVSSLIEETLEGGAVEEADVEATEQPISIVDRMIGSVELREPPPGTDLRYDYLKAKYVRP